MDQPIIVRKVTNSSLVWKVTYFLQHKKYAYFYFCRPQAVDNGAKLQCVVIPTDGNSVVVHKILNVACKLTFALTFLRTFRSDDKLNIPFI